MKRSELAVLHMTETGRTGQESQDACEDRLFGFLVADKIALAVCISALGIPSAPGCRPWGYPLSYMQSQARPLVQMSPRLQPHHQADRGRAWPRPAR